MNRGPRSNNPWWTPRRLPDVVTASSSRPEASTLEVGRRSVTSFRRLASLHVNALTRWVARMTRSKQSTRSAGPPPTERSGSPGIRCHGGHPRHAARTRVGWNTRGAPPSRPTPLRERRGGRSERGRDAQCGADAEGLRPVDRDEPIEVAEQLNRERLGEARGVEACHDTRPCEERWCP